MVTKTQLKQLINCSPELKEKLKEEFYKQKIQEAKDKKKISIEFNWDDIPEEVEQIIIKYKEELEYSGEVWDEKGYVCDAVKKYNITGKSIKEYLFKVYKNENGEKIKSIMKPTYYINKFIWCMINKKSFIEQKYYNNPGKKCEIADSEFLRITKNKSPSLEELIVFRQKQKKKQSEDRKAYNKAHAKYKDEEFKKLSKFKEGDLVYIGDRYDGYTALMITGETKTQYRVEQVMWDYDGYCSNDGITEYINFGLGVDETKWIKKKHKNVGKKTFMSKLEIESKSNHYIDVCNDDLYYVYYSRSVYY